MLILYNLLQWLGTLLLLPLLVVIVAATPKYRGRIPGRLGAGLDKLVAGLRDSRPRIWIHALSVGEVSSAVPLVKSIRESFPAHAVVFSATTRTGEELARRKLAEHVDLFVPFPLDFSFAVKRFIGLVRPAAFILVETDLWPNFIHTLARENIPALLVNGRVSQKSFNLYRKLGFLFAPLFDSFCFISMQTAADAEKMIDLGVAPGKVKPLGNLKYDAALPDKVPGLPGSDVIRRDFQIPPGKTVWVAGSTHAGEEEIIVAVFKDLLSLMPDLFLVVAPRQPDRTAAVIALASAKGLNSRRRSAGAGGAATDCQLMVLDTLGELASLYSICDMAFIGGSLVADGGHNPLEAAAHGRPVLFGPHMDDFNEIAGDLLRIGGGRCVRSADELAAAMKLWLNDAGEREKAGGKAMELVRRHQGVTGRHLEVLRDILRRPRCSPARNRDTLLSSLFIAGRPFSFLYGTVMSARAALYRAGILRRHTVDALVISVGNLNLGGTGKTPLVQYIARYLGKMGRRPAVVSRGYGGSAQAPVNVVSDGRDILLEAMQCGDEPRLHAEALQGVPVLTGKKRILPIRYAVHSLGADAVILDDGFQHLAAGRDLDLVLFNVRQISPPVLKNSRVLPGGPLRESPSALHRAHAFVLTSANLQDQRQVEDLKRFLAARFPDRPVFTAAYKAKAVLDRAGNEGLSLAGIGDIPLHGFCGIADPAAFYQTLVEAGCRLQGFTPFADHHPYTLADMENLRTTAFTNNCQGLITTEKDMVKIREKAPADLRLFSLRVELIPDPGFDRFLDSFLL